MTITIKHRTEYTFTAPVFLEPHVLRLHPRPGPACRVHEHRLAIDPAPTLRAETLDPHGNTVTEAWFDEVTSALTVASYAVVEPLSSDPFRFLVAEPDRTLPYAYPLELGDQLVVYRRAVDAVHPIVRNLALEAATAAGRQQDRFPLTLALMIQQSFTIESRETGGPRPPAETINRRAGASRDLALLFVECCRAMGLAARFVNGYCVDSTGLRSWGEVFLPGGGWRGYDPSEGMAVSDQHIALAAAARPENAVPVVGSYRGDAVSSLRTSVRVNAFS